MLATNARITTVLVAGPAGDGAPAASDHAQAETFRAAVAESGGTTMADTQGRLVADFPNAINALGAASELRKAAAAAAEDGTTGAMSWGLHLGEVTDESGALSGDGIRVAAHLQARAGPGEIMISSAVQEQVEDRFDASYHHAGEHAIADIGHLIVAYSVDDADARRSIRDILSELVRRRVFRSAGAYLVVAWLLVQAGDIVLPVFVASPEWIMRVLITLLAAGFPLAMLISWSMNISTDGLIRTPDSGYSRTAGRWLRFSVVGVAAGISGFVLWSVWVGLLLPMENAGTVTRPEIKRNPVIVVAPLTKRVGGADVDWIGSGIANLMRDSLANSSGTIVYSLGALRAIAAGAGDDGSLSRAARDAGADYLIDGDYISTGGRIIVTTRIEDLESGTIIPGERVEADSVEEAIAGVARITRRIRQTLNLPYRDQVGHLAADFAADNLQAYELYVSGLELLSVYDYENAERLLADALEAAPDFGIARFRLAQILEATGRNAEAADMLARVDVSKMSEREALYVSAARHKFAQNRDTETAIRLYRELIDKYPYDSEAHQSLAEAYWLDYQDDASVQQLKELVAIHPGEAVSWMALGERQVDVGDVEGARVSLARYVTMRPEDPYPYALLAALAMRERRLEDARAEYERALAIRPSMGMAELGLARIDYLEGDAAGALARWRSIIADTDSEADYRIDAAFDLAHTLMSRGRFADAEAALEAVGAEIRAEGFREALAFTVRAFTHMERNQPDTARSLLREGVERTPASGQPTRQHLFLGLLAVRQGDMAALDEAIASLNALAIEPDSPASADRSAALDYLAGLRVASTDPAAAIAPLRRAVESGGYQYRLYALALARATADAGDADGALSVLDAMPDIDPGEPRLDLEYDRQLARLLRAQLLVDLTRPREARELLTSFMADWRGAEDPHPAVRQAQALLAATN